ncbi:MAG: hypothetical protein HPY50_22335 [Firmicutes bacterium]|nr:hypothetical protein [Bacillota bacterium]
MKELLRDLLQRLGIPEKLITDPAYERIIQLKQEIARMQLQNFLQDDLHKWTWWLNLAVAIIPLAVWWFVVDRKRILEIALFGMFMLLMSTILDVAGHAANLWDYPDKLLPFLPVLPIDYIVIPFTFMLLYQRFRPWLSFTIASVVTSAVFSFIMEPIVSWLNLATYLNWKFVYSFPIYIAMAALSRWLVDRLLARQIKSRKNIFIKKNKE